MQFTISLRLGLGFAGLAMSALSAAGAGEPARPIDRQALVTRHNPKITTAEAWAPLSVGNGRFCFTGDVTGLQTFTEHYQQHGIPLETQARWSWHSNPNPNGYKLEDANRPFTAYGKTKGYPTNDKGPAGQWLRENPHAMPLPRIAFDLAREGGAPLAPADVNNPRLDWTQPETHTTTIAAQTDRTLALRHERDGSTYHLLVASEQAWAPLRTGPHSFRLEPTAAPVFEFTVAFGPTPPAVGVTFRDVVGSAGGHWARFWQSGGAIDFSGSTDPRAAELERRVVLSQYLTAIQFTGDFPPSESGLTNSTWYQKHHTEMIWWHTAHFALWGRGEYLAKNLDWFVGNLPVARALARSRGLEGARWAKMIGPDGRESPGGNPLITWNQPHPIHLAELLYRDTPTPATLARYRELVQDTAAAMASMLHWDAPRQRFNLGPPMWIAQEIYDQATSMNPTYELSYWIRGLTIAQQWRERLGLPRDAEWDRRIKLIAALPQKDGKYVAIETTPDTWDNQASRHDHPSFLMALGQLPGDGVDRAVMARTLEAVLASWDWETKIWGWDYPMVAMTAARLGEPKKAVDILLFTAGPNNAYKPNGHCPQRQDLPVYLPANGALLAAVALMAGGWDDAPKMNAPGFPRDGTWVVRSEGLRPLP
jgi:hypothetical protein